MFPFVVDAVAHAFFYQTHITSIHWKNGKSHGHHEFVTEAKKDASDRSTPKKMMEPDEYTVGDICFCLFKTTYPATLSSATCILAQAGYNNCYLPPPEMIVA